MVDGLISQEQWMGCYGLRGYVVYHYTGRVGSARDAERGPLHRVPDMCVDASLIAALCTTLATISSNRTDAQIGGGCHPFNGEQASRHCSGRIGETSAQILPTSSFRFRCAVAKAAEKYSKVSKLLDATLHGCYMRWR